ncbi:fibrinogen-like protein 1 [Menidia menidia]
MKGLLGFCGLVLALLLTFSGQAEGKRKVRSVEGTDCSDIKTRSPQAASGVYEIQPVGAPGSIAVYCEMRPDGGWTVFQKRTGWAVSFDRIWASYKSGFGYLTNDHWLGLQSVYSITKDTSKSWTLRVDLWDHEGGTAFAEYRNFRLGHESTAYKLYVGTYSGNAGRQ